MITDKEAEEEPVPLRMKVKGPRRHQAAGQASLTAVEVLIKDVERKEKEDLNTI